MNAKQLIKKYESLAQAIEVNFVNSKTETFIQQNNELKTFAKTNGKVISVRMIVNGCYGLSSTNNFNHLEKIFKKSYGLAKSGSNIKKNKTIIKETEIKKDNIKLKIKINPFEISSEEKINFLKEYNKTYSLKDIKNKETFIRFNQGTKTYLNNKGANIVQDYNYSQLFSTIYGGSSLESANVIYRSQKGYEFFNYDYISQIKKVEEKLKHLLNAKKFTPGKYDVVIDPELTGTFFHEAVGHSLEADTLREKSTCLELNETVSSKDLTLIDDPTLKDYWGSYKYDDEGIKSTPQTLIKEGKIINFLNNKSSYYDVEGLTKTANGRMQSPHSMPIPRMSNLVIKTGQYSKNDLIKKIKNGLLVGGFCGGAVEPITGTFSFKSDYAYKIENGVITEKLKGVTLSGNLKEILKNIVGFGKEVDDLWSGGTCGKKGQHVPVSEKVPYIAVRGVTVGN